MSYLFIRRQGISSHLQTIWGAWVFHPVALLKLMFYRLEMGVSGNLWIVVKDVMTLVVYDVESYTWGIKNFHKCWLGPWLRGESALGPRCNKPHSTICIVLLSEFVSRNAWLQQSWSSSVHFRCTVPFPPTKSKNSQPVPSRGETERIPETNGFSRYWDIPENTPLRASWPKAAELSLRLSWSTVWPIDYSGEPRGARLYERATPCWGPESVTNLRFGWWLLESPYLRNKCSWEMKVIFIQEASNLERRQTHSQEPYLKILLDHKSI